jgi:hypothetical protein
VGRVDDAVGELNTAPSSICTTSRYSQLNCQSGHWNPVMASPLMNIQT